MTDEAKQLARLADAAEAIIGDAERYRELYETERHARRCTEHKARFLIAAIIIQFGVTLIYFSAS